MLLRTIAHWLVFAVPPEPPKPVFPVTKCILDTNGVPLPDTPQLLAIQQLQVSCTELATVVTAARTSGADAACIATAEAALKICKADAAAAMEAEKERVALARVERAKLSKKKKGKPKK
jgi:hypothetical protein